MDKEERHYLCHECVDDDYFKQIIKDEGRRRKCSFCETVHKCLDLDEVTEKVDVVFRENYTPSEEYPTFNLESDKVYWEYHGEYPEAIISEMLKVEYDIAEKIVENLVKISAYDAIREGGDNFYSDEMQYEEVKASTYGYSEIWSEFCQSVKHYSRFFNPEAEVLLREIFLDVERIYSLEGQPAIRVLPDGEVDRTIFRGRQADDDPTRVKIIRTPWIELGPPPDHIASGGRMNPPGISVFYGAFERETCISELRLPVGSIGITGQFEIIRPVQVLDLTIFDNPHISLSMFDPGYQRRLSQLLFLKKFHKEIRKPVLPRDETIDYLPTQVVAEFLANKFVPKIDGLIYSSSQTNGEGRNIVLFNHASGIVNDKNGTETVNKNDQLKTYLYEDEEEGEYTYVIEKNEELRDEDGKPQNRPIPFFVNDEDHFITGQTRLVTLRFIEGSLKFEKVISINHETNSYRIYDSSNEPVDPDVFERVRRLFEGDDHIPDVIF